MISQEDERPLQRKNQRSRSSSYQTRDSIHAPKTKVKSCFPFNYFHIACKVNFCSDLVRVKYGEEHKVYTIPLLMPQCLFWKSRRAFKCKFCSLHFLMMLQEVTLWSFSEKAAVYLIHFALLFQCLSFLLEVIAAKLFPLQNCSVIFRPYAWAF